MSETALTLRALLRRLDDAGALEAGAEERVRAALAKPPVAGEALFIQVLIGVGAWLAGLCFFAFVATLLGGVFRLSDKPFVALGAAWIGVAVLMHRFGSPASIFFRQLALACSVAGHAMVFVGLADALHYSHGIPAITAVAVALAVVLYFVYDDPVHRFASALNALTWVQVLIWEREVVGVSHAVVCVEAVAVGLIFLDRRAPRGLRPVGYACAIPMLGGLAWMMFEGRHFLWHSWHSGVWIWPSSILMSIAWAVLAAHLCGYVGGRRIALPAPEARAKIMVLVILAALVLAALQLPGVAAALGVLALGFAVSERYLVALGLLALPFFLGHFYFSLEQDLMTKSLLLTGTGFVCLGLRVLVGRLFALRQGVGDRG